MIASGVQRPEDVHWSLGPKKDLSFSEAFVALENIVFAFGFASSQPSFMAEMHETRGLREIHQNSLRGGNHCVYIDRSDYLLSRWG